MNILHYSENVYYQFFRKLDEVGYFLNEAVINQEEYKDASLPKDNKFFDKMQFTFSAFLGALVSTWEISKLSLELENFIDGRAKNHKLPSERLLTSDFSEFKNFFTLADNEMHNWFCFLKAARNASAHDGSCAVNGGNVEIFKFQTHIHRFGWEKSTNEFKYLYTPAAQCSAVTSMLAMAYKLSPLFFSKLKCPAISPEVGKEIGRFNIDSSLDLNALPNDVRDQIINSLSAARLNTPKGNIDEKVTKWERMYKSRFINNCQQ